MTAIQDLPDLVIIGILRNAVEEVVEAEDLVSNLPYLAICQRWRHLALPMVYNNMVIKYGIESIKDEDEDEDDDDEKVYKFVSNTSLLANANCNLLVKCLNIRWLAKSFIEDLHILMNTVAMNETGWPKDISGHLVGDTSSEDFYYNPQKLDNEMYEKMSAIIENFKDTFPNVKRFFFGIDDCCGVGSQFISKFVDVYFNQLTRLINFGNVPLDLPCLPPNLTHLYYTYDTSPVITMPKINPLPLKVLKLDDIPNNFTWEQSFSSLVFPNLENLTLNNLNTIDPDAREEHVPKINILDNQYEGLEFPVINRLSLSLTSELMSGFNIKEIPRHLGKLSYSGNLEGLEQISNLPIDSLGILDITFDERVENLDKFYKVTNKMFGKSIKNNTITAFAYDCEAPVIDFQKIKWENVTEMYFQYLDNTALVKVIAAIPQLKAFTVGTWSYVDGDVDWGSVANSKIEELYLSHLEYDGLWENPANYIVQLLKSFKCLRYVNIPEKLNDVFLPKLEEAKKEFQHFQEFDRFI